MALQPTDRRKAKQHMNEKAKIPARLQARVDRFLDDRNISSQLNAELTRSVWAGLYQ